MFGTLSFLSTHHQRAARSFCSESTPPKRRGTTYSKPIITHSASAFFSVCLTHHLHIRRSGIIQLDFRFNHFLFRFVPASLILPLSLPSISYSDKSNWIKK